MALKVLVADDDRFVRRLICEALSFKGFSVRESEDGEDTLKKLEEDLPDVLILDLMMPKVSGFEVYRRIRATEKWGSLSVIVCSAIEESLLDKVQRMILHGVRGYVSKPFSMKKLVERLEAVADKKNGQFSVL